MSYPKDYYWKNKQGKIIKTVGIELTVEEKLELARKNNRLIRIGYGKTNTALRGV